MVVEPAVAFREMWLMVCGSRWVLGVSLLEPAVFGSAVDHWECSGLRGKCLC